MLLNKVVFIFFVCYVQITSGRVFPGGKSRDPVLTYFRRVDEAGRIVDRKGNEYDQDIQTAIISSVLETDSAATLEIIPETVQNGEQVKVKWHGVQKPQKIDWIGFYCPGEDDPHHYLDFFKVSVSSTWAKGFGSASVYVYNMRTTCQFKYYRNNNYSQLVASSTPLSFIGGTEQPVHGHLSLTGDPTEIRVMWTSGFVQKPVVRYGTNIGSLDNMITADSHTYKGSDMCGPPASTVGFWDPGYMHSAILKGLQHNKMYYYTFGSDKGMSDTYNFTTGLQRGDQSPFRFIMFGDMGISPYPGGHETAKLMQREIMENGARLIIHDGDISYAEGMAYIWEQWFTLIENYATLVPYMVTIGNHEQDHTSGGSKDPSGAPGEGFHPTWGNFGDDSGGECGVPMFNRFKMPANGNSLWWYSFDYGMVHFTMMSTEHNFTKGSRQYEWLVQDLQSVNRKLTPWIILVGHRPMYCSGYYPGDYEVSLFLQKSLEDVVFKYKVDVAVWGHYHSYERTCQVYKGECGQQGTIHLVIGSAGASLDSGVHYKKKWSIFTEDCYGYGRFTAANSSALHFEFVRNRDQVVTDHVWVLK